MIKFTLHAFLLIFFINILDAQTGNVGIGTSTPDASAILDITSTTKGVLMPRVSLPSQPTTPAPYLVVFNTNAAYSSGPSGAYGTGIGYYFNSGNAVSPKWEKLPTTLDVAALITASGGGVPTTRTITMSGSANQISVTGSDVPYDLSANRSWTFSLPQNIHTGASPTFTGATLTGLSTAGIVTNTSGGVLGTTSLVPIANGGTNSNATATNGGVGYGTGTAHDYTAAGTSGQILRSNGAAAPTWANPTSLFTVNNGLTATSPSTIQLGGSLTQNTTITQGAYPLTIANDNGQNTIINLSSTGDFDVQDNGTSAFFVRDNGNVGVGTTIPGAKLDIKHGTAGNTGLRFTNFTAPNATNIPALGVNVLGDVVQAVRGNVSVANVAGSWPQNVLTFTATGRSYLLLYNVSIYSSTPLTTKSVYIKNSIGTITFATTNFYFTTANQYMQISGSAVITPTQGGTTLRIETTGSSDGNATGTVTVIEL